MTHLIACFLALPIDERLSMRPIRAGNENKYDINGCCNHFINSGIRIRCCKYGLGMNYEFVPAEGNEDIIGITPNIGMTVEGEKHAAHRGSRSWKTTRMQYKLPTIQIPS